MPKIMIDARFSIRYEKTVTTEQMRRLEDGEDIDLVTDVESDGYQRLATDGDVDAEWEYIAPLKKVKTKRKR